MNRKTAVIAIVVMAIIVISILAVMFFGNSMYEWMLRVHHLR